MVNSQASSGIWFASDLARCSAAEIPGQDPVCLTGVEAGDGVGSDRVRSEQAQAAEAVVGGAEVRDLCGGADRTGHSARGGREVRRRPLHGGDGLPDREAGRPGCARGGGAGSARHDGGAGCAGRREGRDRPAPGDGHRAGGRVAPARGKSILGLSAGPVPARVGATVKAGLLDLVDAAVEQGWTRRRAAAVHGLLPAERDAIVWLHEHWGGVDKSHRKLAHRGSRLDLVHVSESTVWRVLKAENLLLPGRSPREPQIKAPWPEWVAWKPNVIWCYDFTHFTRASGLPSPCSTSSPASGWPPWSARRRPPPRS